MTLPRGRWRSCLYLAAHWWPMKASGFWLEKGVFPIWNIWIYLVVCRSLQPDWLSWSVPVGPLTTPICFTVITWWTILTRWRPVDVRIWRSAPGNVAGPDSNRFSTETGVIEITLPWRVSFSNIFAVLYDVYVLCFTVNGDVACFFSIDTTITWLPFTQFFVSESVLQINIQVLLFFSCFLFNSFDHSFAKWSPNGEIPYDTKISYD